MAWALIGKLQWALRRDFSPGYTAAMVQWQRRALEHIKLNLGFMPGLAIHYFHGHKAKRQYQTREKILAETHFDPAIDLKRGSQGLYQLERSSPHYADLRDRLRDYFRQRDEDTHG
jgi:hypothetical protein